MASGNVTVTAPIGPGNTVSSLVFSSAKAVLFDMEREVMVITKSNGVKVEFEYETIATVTYTISGEVATITVST